MNEVRGYKSIRGLHPKVPPKCFGRRVSLRRCTTVLSEMSREEWYAEQTVTRLLCLTGVRPLTERTGKVTPNQWFLKTKTRVH
jgi:hypothetical protein